MITVALEGKTLFNWSGDEAAIAGLEGKVREVAIAANQDPQDVATTTIVNLAKVWAAQRSNPRGSQGTMMTVIYYLLQLDTGHPDHPGKYRDYVPVWDFNFDIHVGGREVKVEVEGFAQQH